MMRKFYLEYMLFTVVLLSLVFCGAVIFSKHFSDSTASEQRNTQFILIDAGHGGEDGGAVSVTGIPESQYNLAIAVKLNDLFNLMGYETHMLRTDDYDLHTEGTTISQRKISDLKQRVNIINNYDNAVLFSIHQNYFSDPRYHGLQAFYYTDSSKALAECIQSSYKSYIEPTNRRLAQRKEGIYLLEHVKCCAVLIECGFISNPAEEKLLNSEQYKQKLASTIVSAYLSITLQ